MYSVTHMYILYTDYITLLLLWKSITSAGDCEWSPTLDVEELQGAYQVDGVADLTTCDEEKSAGVSGR